MSLIMLLFFLSIVLSLSECLQVKQPPYGQLRVQGSQLLSSSGQQVVLRGMSLFWSQWDPNYWKAETVKQLKCSWRINVIRAPLGVEGDGNYLQNNDQAGNMKKLTTIVDAAIENGIYVIIDWHYTSGTAYTNQAITFFKQMAQKYGGYPHVIYEVWNEPVGVSWAGVLKPYHQKLIPAIRGIDKDNIIIVGTESYDMNLNPTIASPITGQTNIMYALHYYAADGTQSSQTNLQNQMINAVKKNLAIFVTESGAGSGGSNAPVNLSIMSQWQSVLNQQKVSQIIWGIRGEGNYQNPLNKGTTPAQIGQDSSLTSYGKTLKQYFISKNPAPTQC